MNGNCYFYHLCINSPEYCSFDSLYRHINFAHGNDPSFKVRCVLTPLCDSIYRTLSSYESHICKHYRELISKLLDKDIFSLSNDDTNNSKFIFT